MALTTAGIGIATQVRLHLKETDITIGIACIHLFGEERVMGRPTFHSRISTTHASTTIHTTTIANTVMRTSKEEMQ